MDNSLWVSGSISTWLHQLNELVKNKDWEDEIEMVVSPFKAQRKKTAEKVKNYF